jgi:hypothetical protein
LVSIVIEESILANTDLAPLASSDILPLCSTQLSVGFHRKIRQSDDRYLFQYDTHPSLAGNKKKGHGPDRPLGLYVRARGCGVPWIETAVFILIFCDS